MSEELAERIYDNIYGITNTIQSIAEDANVECLYCAKTFQLDEKTVINMFLDNSDQIQYKCPHCQTKLIIERVIYFTHKYRE